MRSGRWWAGIALMLVAATAIAGPRPSWIDVPPRHTADTLYFVGTASGADSVEKARGQAVLKAEAEVVAYFGQRVHSELLSKEVERNGVYRGDVSLIIRVDGEEVRLQRVQVEGLFDEPSRSAGFDAYALVSYPRTEYERVLAERRKTAQALADRALALFRDGQALHDAGHPADAEDRFQRAVEALRGVTVPVELADRTVTSTVVLARELEAALATTRHSGAAAQRTVALAVVTAWTGVPEGPGSVGDDVRTQLGRDVTARGLTAGAGKIEDAVARAVLSGDIAAASRAGAATGAAWLLLVQFDCAITSELYGQIFAEASGRYELVEAASGRRVASGDLPVAKGGHVRRRDACMKAIDPARKALADAIPGVLSRVSNAGGATR